MPDNRFVPLVPRQLARVCPSVTTTADPAASTEDLPTPVDADPENASEQPVEVAAACAIETEYPDVVSVRDLAIELAAAACARALRYAVDRNPRLLARFVDDALRAAGNPKDAVVRVATPTAFTGDHPGTHALVADPSLSAGDVFVTCDAGTLGATIEERAALLVRAASQ